MQRMAGHLTLKILIVLLLLFIGQQVRAATVVIDAQQARYPIGGHTELFEDSSGVLTIEQLSADDAPFDFKPSQAEVPNLGYGHSAIWARFRIRNDSLHHEWWLQVGKPRLQSVTLYQLAPLGGWQQQRQGTSYPFEMREIKQRAHLFRIKIAPGDERTYYLRIQSQTHRSLSVNLWQPAAFTEQADRSSALKTALYGVLIGIGIYYLLTSLILRETLYLQFALFCFTYLFYSATLNGYVQQYFPQIDGDWLPLRLLTIGIASMSFFFLAYSRSFLQTRHYSPFWHRILGILMVVPLVAGVWSLGPEYDLPNKILNMAGPLSGLVCFAAALTVLYRGYRPARMYVATLAIFLTGVAVRVLGLFGVLPVVLGETEQLITLLAVIPMFAVSFADRYNLLRQEKDAAQSRALEAERILVQELESKISERTQELEQARKQAEAASQAKGEFLAVMSHELRTPMTAVLGVTQLMDRSDFNERNRKLLETLDSSGRHLLTLIDDVLDLSKAEQGPLTLKQETFSPEPLFQEIVELLQPVARERGISLSFSSDALPPWTSGDPVRLRQVVTNLVANALKYTEQGEVRVEVEAQPSTDGSLLLRASIQDTGIGIEPARLQQIFQPFEQIDASDRRRQGGAGLGLAICQRLVEAMDGNIGVESEPGKGSLFWFTVRLRYAEPERETPINVTDRPAPLRILLVDDVAANREIVGHLLRRDGHQVTVADSGKKAIELAEIESFELVLMDIQMPDMDGFEACRRIREQTDNQVPIFALTASTSAAMVERCNTAGMNGLVSKPLRIEELYATLESYRTGAEVAVEPVSESEQDPLASYRHYLSDDELADLLAVQQATLAQQESRLEAAWKANDLVELAQSAHQIAGIAGIPRARTELARGIESAAMAKDRAKLSELIAEYETIQLVVAL